MEYGILLAEDNCNDAELLKRVFNQVGLKNPIYHVKDGEETISYLAALGQYSDRLKYPMPSILLLDINIPKKDGFAVLEWITSQRALRRLLIIVLTGSEDRKSINRAYELGANSFLTKPTSQQELQNMVEFFKGYWLLSGRMPDPPQ